MNKDLIKSISKKLFNYETITYILVGIATTLVDFFVFALLNENLKQSMDETSAVMTAQALSWISAVLFAYITNKLIVFKSYEFSPAYILKELSSFFAARLLSGVIVFVLIYVTVDMMHMNEYISKLISSGINLVLNYVASKLIIFKKR